MRQVSNKEVDLGEPTSFLDHEYLGCTQRQCEISKDIVDNYRTMFETRISAGAAENYHARKIWVCLRGLVTWKVMPRNVWNDIVSWQTRRLNNSTKYQLHALMKDFKEEELKSVGELSKVCSQIVQKCFFLARLGRPDILWSVSEPLNGPKCVTNARIFWSLTLITQLNTNNIAMWETLQNNADWDCSKTPILQEILEIQNLLQVEHCAFLEVIRSFQSGGCVRNKLQFRTAQQNQK